MRETVFTWAAPPIKFGLGAVDEIGFDVASLGVRRVLVLTDPGVSATGLPDRVRRSLTEQELEVDVFDGVHVEPTDVSMRAAVAYAQAHGPWDGFVAVGGGSTIDTAKVVDLLTSHGGDLMDYVNKPIGQGRAPAGPVKPMVAIPTTAGTGAECTAVCIMDLLEHQVKTGISHWRLRPSLAVVDPSVTVGLPPMVTAATGFDVLCHALESYTARPFSSYDKKRPEERVAYCGANPISDLWIEHTLPLHARAFRTAVQHGDDMAARTDMLQAALFAGMGFGNAGVHIPHACAYPIAGRVRDYRPRDYPQAEAMVPHGMAVVLTAAAAFRQTFDADPARHLAAARILEPAADGAGDQRDGAGDERGRLPRAVLGLMRDTGMPNGLAELGYSSGDLDDLVQGALQQQRLLTIAPIEVDAGVLRRVFEESMRLW